MSDKLDIIGPRPDNRHPWSCACELCRPTMKELKAHINTITGLAEEIDALKAENAKLKEEMASVELLLDGAKAKVRELQEEIARKDEALQKIVSGITKEYYPYRIAQQALEDESEIIPDAEYMENVARYDGEDKS